MANRSLIGFALLAIVSTACTQPAPAAPTAAPPAAPTIAAKPAATAPPSAATAPAKPTAAAAAKPAGPPGVKDAGRQQQLYEAAKKEGAVVGYVGDDVALFKALEEAFEKRFPGIDAQLSNISSRQGGEKIIAEGAARRQTGDIISGGSNAIYNVELEGFIEPYVSSELDIVDPVLGHPRYTALRANIRGFGYNTNLVKANEVPRSWRDLLDAKWKGKLAIEDPVIGSGGGYTMFVTLALTPELGLPYVQALAAQRPFRTTGSSATRMQSVLRGEYLVNATDHNGAFFVAREGGAPIGFQVPVDGSLPVQLFTGLVKGAAHPNAAKLWIDFTVGAEAQAIIAKFDNTPVQKGVKAVPEASLEGAKLLPTPSNDELELNKSKWIATFKEIFGQ